MTQPNSTALPIHEVSVLAAAQLPPELQRALKLAHRSPTYSIVLLDGRVLHVRREAHAFRDDGTVDAEALYRGDGEVRWWARCESVEACGYATLGDAILSAAGLRSNESDSADEAWEKIRILVGAALSLADAAVPCERQAVEA